MQWWCVVSRQSTGTDALVVCNELDDRWSRFANGVNLWKEGNSGFASGALVEG
jgi:hypothetical protein